MKVLILAAGRGSRLNNKTRNKPKALVEVDNIKLLDYQLNVLKKFIIKEICIVVGYKSKKILDFIKKKQFFKFTIVSNHKYHKTDSAYSFSLAKKFIFNSDYIHLNCDIIFDNIVLEKILKSSKKNILCCRMDLQLSEKMDLVVTKKSRIIKFDNKYYPEAKKKVFGVAKISKELGKRILNKVELDIKKNRLNKKCFSYFKTLCKKNDIYSINFKKTNLVEINNLDDIKNRK